MYFIDTDEELHRIARKSAEEKVGFYTHFAIYVVVNLFLIVIWYFTGDGFPWFIFPLFGWGIAVAVHFVSAFKGHAYTETLAEQEYQRLKEKRQKIFFLDKQRPGDLPTSVTGVSKHRETEKLVI